MAGAVEGAVGTGATAGGAFDVVEALGADINLLDTHPHSTAAYAPSRCNNVMSALEDIIFEGCGDRWITAGS